MGLATSSLKKHWPLEKLTNCWCLPSQKKNQFLNLFLNQKNQACIQTWRYLLPTFWTFSMSDQNKFVLTLKTLFNQFPFNYEHSLQLKLPICSMNSLIIFTKELLN